jgi:hypothetical protein
MQNKTITKAYIRSIDDTTFPQIKLNISLSDIKETEKLPYMLIIQSKAEKCFRITIYPILKKEIIKIILYGNNISDNIINKLSKILKKYELIHTSGLIIKNKKLFYECYINLSLSDDKFQELKNSLDKIKNKFKKIDIEEINLKLNSEV